MIAIDTMYTAIRTLIATTLLQTHHLHYSFFPCTMSSSARRYSPTSAWWNATMDDASSLRQSCVLLAATPNPSGTSDMENTTTPWFAGVFSVIRPRPDFNRWLPYRKDISLVGLTHICVEKAYVEARSIDRSIRRTRRAKGSVAGDAETKTNPRRNESIETTSFPSFVTTNEKDVTNRAALAVLASRRPSRARGMRRFSSQRFRLKTEMRRITGATKRTRRGGEGKRAEERTRRSDAAAEKQASFANNANDASEASPVAGVPMFRVRGEELKRADGEPELVRVRELPDAHAEGNQLVSRDARRAFHDILADAHALRV